MPRSYDGLIDDVHKELLNPVACSTYTYTMSADFVTTIDSDDEVSNYGGESSKPQKSKKAEDEELDPEFEFDFGGGGSAGVDLWGGDEVRVGDKGKDVGSISRLK